jgi:hypothetical protein
MNIKVHQYKALPIEGRRKTAHAYFFPMNETVIDNLYFRRSRPHKQYRVLLNEILAKEGYTKKEIGRVTWSQKCGCSCGCSPGFRIEGLYGKDYFVDVK